MLLPIYQHFHSLIFQCGVQCMLYKPRCTLKHLVTIPFSKCYGLIVFTGLFLFVLQQSIYKATNLQNTLKSALTNGRSQVSYPETSTTMYKRSLYHLLTESSFMAGFFKLDCKSNDLHAYMHKTKSCHSSENLQKPLTGSFSLFIAM